MVYNIYHYILYVEFGIIIYEQNLPDRCGLIPICTAPQIFPFQMSKGAKFVVKTNDFCGNWILKVPI